MNSISVTKLGQYLPLVAFLAFVAAGAPPVQASHEHEEKNGRTTALKSTRLAMPMMDVERGKKLFVSKGCVACHAINGVGGHDAPSMDDHTKLGLVNPFDFVAKMWNHAPAMLAAQVGAFDEPINFTGDEISDVIAFVHNDKAQHAFSETDLTAKVRKMMEHGHGGKSAPDVHAEDVGHK